jgi:hypothetical protein
MPVCGCVCSDGIKTSGALIVRFRFCAFVGIEEKMNNAQNSKTIFDEKEQLILIMLLSPDLFI